jgi:hypothetical protein
MGFDHHFAWQQSPAPNVRFGSKADIGACPRDVRFTPKADIRRHNLLPAALDGQKAWN